MATEHSPNWQRHLDELDKHYSPENFFVDHFSRPKMDSDLREDYFSNILAENNEVTEEGQLSIDVFQDEKNIYVLAPIAGARAEDLDISVEKDLLTIKGRRHSEISIEDKNQIYRECYWGNFSRSIILPCSVEETGAVASFQNCVLKLILPKAPEAKKISITINYQ